MGGKVVMPPQDIPQVGRFCVLQDPQGAMINAITYVQEVQQGA
jgi:predicted enzyme related to lactoylglutathione lyase